MPTQGFKELTKMARLMVRPALVLLSAAALTMSMVPSAAFAAHTSQTSSVEQRAASKPSRPLDLTASRGINRVTLTWSPPASNGGAKIREYNVYVSTASETGPWRKSATVRSLTASVAGLVDGRVYWFKVAAVNSAGEGRGSVVKVDFSKPSSPRGVAATPGDSQATITWEAPISDGGSPIVDYQVEYRDTGQADNPWIPAQDGDATASPVAIPGLINGTRYAFRVAAVTATSTGAFSRPVIATPSTRPAQPTGLAARGSDGQVRLTWTVPSSGGNRIIDYTVQLRQTGSAAEWQTFARPASAKPTALVTGLANGTSYDFRVAAVSSIGSSDFSLEVSETPGTTPAAPTTLAATAGVASASLAWGPPANDGGSVLIGYYVYRSLTESGPWTYLDYVSDPAYQATGLDGNVTYWFKVVAFNRFGAGPGVVASVTPLTVFGAPTVTGVSMVGPTSEQADVVFTPGSTGGRTIIGYEYSIDDGTTWRTAISQTATSLRTASVAPTKRGYSYRVRAVASNGDKSLPSAVIAKPVAAPTGLAVTPQRGYERVGSASMTVAWAATPDTTYYKLLRADAPGGLPWNVGAPNWADTDLPWNTKESYRVAACNAGGCSVYTSQVSDITAPPPLKWTLAPASGALTLTVDSFPEGTVSFRVKLCDRTANPTCSPDTGAVQGTYNNAGKRTIPATAGRTYAVIVIACSGANGSGRQTVSTLKTATPTK